jgi:hypothetical protein
VLQVISSSPGELAPVFQAMLANAVRLCEAKFGFLYLYEGGAFRIVAAHDVPLAFSEARTRTLLYPPPGGPLAEVIRTKQAVQVADLAATPVYAERSPPVVDAVELGGIRTQVTVPLLKDNELIGVIRLANHNCNFYRLKARALLPSTPVMTHSVCVVANPGPLVKTSPRRVGALTRSAPCAICVLRFPAATFAQQQQPDHAVGGTIAVVLCRSR